MPELWIPFGQVETLVTVQAENLGSVAEHDPVKDEVEAERFLSAVDRASAIFICDSLPATNEVLRKASSKLADREGLRIFSSAPKRAESAVPEIRGRIATLPPPISREGDGLSYAQELTERGPKVFLGTARPDPLFGVVDAKAEACLNWVAQSMREAARARKSMEPAPFKKTEARGAIESIAKGIVDGSFFSVVPRGGKAAALLADAPFDAIKTRFRTSSLTPAKAIVVGAGGRGYDDTLSSAIRTVWSSLPGVRRSGSVLLVAECSDGLGSMALEMVATGRITATAERRKEKYIDGIEEILYLTKLKQEYDVLLLSGLPEVYAKSKLGLTTARGSGEAVGRLLNKLGRSGKINVVTRAGETRIESA